LLLEKLSKSLIPLSDCPLRAQSPPCFSWKISLFPGCFVLQRCLGRWQLD
jgi:hypothetical protein